MPVNAITGLGVSAAYGSTQVLSRSDFTIPEGGITALIGPNGSGKSTLLAMIAGLHPLASGNIDILPVDGRPRRLAYVFQSTKVNDTLPVTVREVVAMGRYPTTGPRRRFTPEDHRIVDDALQRMGIADLQARHLKELSGGQRQRVFVAQGLAQDHDVLMLDEPLTGLDMPSARAIDDVIHDENSRGCTVIITTHDLSEARRSDHVILLAGRVVSNGPPADALADEHLTAAYGPHLLHDETATPLIDDPAHITRQSHRHRPRPG
ncbi:MAG TPA: zinc ABC transporter ATP-binding protein AztA [Acidimicrobiia bacterium]|nr:zinc ABC transporter ATP-binding protein AztA [Acidimicrobiia bacterium]